MADVNGPLGQRGSIHTATFDPQETKTAGKPSRRQKGKAPGFIGWKGEDDSWTSFLFKKEEETFNYICNPSSSLSETPF
jgi:hypothetical protein